MEQTSMEKKSFNDLLPLELIRAILLRLPIKHLVCLRCVSKLWNTLISDPNFAKSHLDHSLAPSHTFLFIQDHSHVHSVDLDALLQDDNDVVYEIASSLPFMKKPPSDFHILGSCRGFVLLHRELQFLILWNPLTDSCKRISYSHLVNARRDCGYPSPPFFNLFHNGLVYGFGYDASQDDYVVVVAYEGMDNENHFDMCCLRSNSWINLDAALPKPFDWYALKPEGLFCNGTIHWSTRNHCEAILIFDLKERSFSNITLPETPLFKPHLVLLGECLAFYLYDLYEEDTTLIWVMKEYKVQSSWTLYEIPLEFFKPLCLSADGDIIGRCSPSDGEIRFYIYNVRGELLKHVQFLYGEPPNRISSIVHVDSLMAVSSNIKQKKRKKGCQNHKEVKQGKGIRSKHGNNLDT